MGRCVSQTVFAIGAILAISTALFPAAAQSPPQAAAKPPYLAPDRKALYREARATLSRLKGKSLGTKPVTGRIAFPPLPNTLAENRDATQVFELARRAIYFVVASEPGPRLRARQPRLTRNEGSAVAISPALLVTNCHVVQGFGRIMLSHSDWGAASVPAEIAHAEWSLDRCWLRRKADASRYVPDLVPVPGARLWRALKRGEKVYAIGNPGGYHLTISSGIVSNLHPVDSNGNGGSLQGGRLAQKWIQTDAELESGSSGGALFDSFGNLIGITTLVDGQRGNLSFAIALEEYWPKAHLERQIALRQIPDPAWHHLRPRAAQVENIAIGWHFNDIFAAIGKAQAEKRPVVAVIVEKSCPACEELVHHLLSCGTFNLHAGAAEFALSDRSSDLAVAVLRLAQEEPRKPALPEIRVIAAGDISGNAEASLLKSKILAPATLISAPSHALGLASAIGARLSSLGATTSPPPGLPGLVAFYTSPEPWTKPRNCLR